MMRNADVQYNTALELPLNTESYSDYDYGACHSRVVHTHWHTDHYDSCGLCQHINFPEGNLLLYNLLRFCVNTELRNVDVSTLLNLAEHPTIGRPYLGLLRFTLSV